VSRDLDEDDVRVRAGRPSRPRTRRRPDHADAQGAIVVTVDRGRYTCRVPGHPRPVIAVRGGNLRRTAVVVGDHVDLVGPLEGQDGSLARIVRRAPRTSVLRRTPDDTDPVERAVVANADLLVVVSSLADPPPQPRLVDRCLVAAFDGGLGAALLLTKGDLPGAGAAAEEVRARYAILDLPVVTVARDEPITALLALVTGRTSVLFGSSGVGKSTLVNRLVPGAERTTGPVGAGGRGRHTTSAAVMLALPDGGWIIDTPGVRSFGLGLLDPARVLAAFPDLLAVAAACPGGCPHTGGGGCALDNVGPALAARVDSYRRLVASRSALPPDLR
jgi:ribosome biogenesis GTPase